jgi:hypothetical protein
MQRGLSCEWEMTEIRSLAGAGGWLVISRDRVHIQYRGPICSQTDGAKFRYITVPIELHRQVRIHGILVRGQCHPGCPVRRVCPAGQSQQSAVVTQAYVIATRRKNPAVAFKAEWHIDRNSIGSKGCRCAKGGCKNEHPQNRTHKNILLLKEHPGS